MLEIKSLQARLGRFSLHLESWQSVSGELHALLGCNGAGKSTLLRCLAGDLPCAGSIRLHGVTLDTWEPLRRARHLAVLPQSSTLNFGFMAQEVVALGATPLKLGWREQHSAILKAMMLADCADIASQPYLALSGGQKQRVHLARVLLQLSQAELPPLLLLDEPTSAQDLQQQHRLLRTVRELCVTQAYGVVAVLHDLNHALRYAHGCSILSDGQLACRGGPAMVLTPETVARYWGYNASCLQDASGLPVLV